VDLFHLDNSLKRLVITRSFGRLLLRHPYMEGLNPIGWLLGHQLQGQGLLMEREMKVETQNIDGIWI